MACACWGCRRWRLFCEGRLLGYPPRPHYEVLTQELVRALAQYIRCALVVPGPDQSRQPRCNGRLTPHYSNQYLKYAPNAPKGLLLKPESLFKYAHQV